MAESYNDSALHQDDNGSARRLALALAISAAAHVALILGVRAAPPQSVAAHVTAIEARLAAPAVNEIKPALSAPPSAEVKSHTVEKTEPVTKTPAIPQTQPAPLPVDAPSLPTLQAPLPEDPNYYPAKKLDQQPVPLQPITPIYPAEAVEANISGRVQVLLFIDENGVVRDISIVKAEPPGYFEGPVLEAFGNARFKPAMKNGRAVKSRMLNSVTFIAR